MTYAELFVIGEKMAAAWDRYCMFGTKQALAAYDAACDEYEAAERICDELPEELVGTNIALWGTV